MSLQCRPGFVLGLVGIASAPVAAFATGGTVVVVAIAGLLLALSSPQLRAVLRDAGNPLCMALIAFLLWAALSSIWAPDPGRSVILVLRCTLLFAAGLSCVAAAAGMPTTERLMAVRGIAAGGVLLILLLGVETASDAALTRFIRGMDLETLEQRTNGVPLARPGTLLAVLCWPALLAVARLSDARMAFFCFLPIPVILVFQPITASAVAIGAGAIVFALVYAKPRAGLALLFALFLVGLAAAPLLPPLLASTAPVEEGAEYLPLSWQHRLEIWQFAADGVAQRPLLGWGFDATRTIGKKTASTVITSRHLAHHPHNFSLQVWLELGAVGAVVALLFASLLWRWLQRWAEDRAAVAAAAAGLTCYLVFGQISRGAWQNWWLAAAWLLATMLVVVMPFRSPSACASGGGDASRAKP